MLRNMNRTLSIRLRVTLLVSLLLLGITLLFAVFSIASGRRNFAAEPLRTSMAKMIEPILSENNNQNPDIQFFGGTWSPVADPEQGMALTVAVSTVEQAQRSFGLEQIVALCLINLLGIGMTYIILGRALRPLTLLSQDIEHIHEHNMQTGLKQVDSQDEIGSLTNSFNAMLARLRRSMEGQRHFAANAAHELKTPLTVMKSSLQVLALEGEQADPAEYRETTALCAETVDQMIVLVDDLLRIGSVQAECSTMVDVNALVTQTLETRAEAIAEKNLHVVRDEASCLVRCKQSLLACIVDNLISNAIKYNRKDGLLSVRLFVEQETLHLHVADSGIGIPPESLPDIFDSFYRVDPSRSKEVEGNGLGLAIVKAAVADLGGSVQVESSLGDGTVFCICLPIEQKDEASEDSEASEKNASSLG